MSQNKTAKKGQGSTKKKGTAPVEVARSVQPKKITKMGRPTTFTQEIADELCEKLSIGQSIRTVCAPDHMPAISTFFKWLRVHPDFAKQYAHAKEEAADAMAEDLLDISDDGSNDWMLQNFGGHEAWITNGEALQRSRLRVDTRKWLMAKMKPRKYGEKLDVTSDGKALPQPIIGINTAKKNDTDTKRDVIDGEIVDEVSENHGEIQSGNVMDDINGN